MFFMNFKELFQHYVIDILIALSIVYFGALVFSVVIKWIQPRLKKYAATYEDQKLDDSIDEFKMVSGRYWNKKNCTDTVNEVSSDSDGDDIYDDEDILNAIENMKSIFKVTNILRKFSKSSNFKTELIDELALGIENAILLRKLCKNTLRSKIVPSDVQTNITISPKVNVDYNSCPTILMSQPFSDIPIEERTSSDSFASAESGDNEYKPIFRQLGCCNLFKRKRNNSNIGFEHIPQNADLKFSVLSNSEHLDTTVTKGFEKYSGYKNKMLQLAICEFERELKPIRDQIKELKECLLGSENDDFKEIKLNFPSDTCTSFTENTKQSEWLTEPLTTPSSLSCYSTVSSVKFSEHHPSTYFRSTLKSQNKENLKSLPLTIKIQNLTPLKSTKHSPLAEMYIQLSHCNSSRALKRQGDEKNMTYHINLNVSFRSSSETSLVNPTSSNSSDIISPLLTEPEEFFGDQPSNIIYEKSSNFQ